jgi:hypothetical protein
MKAHFDSENEASAFVVISRAREGGFGRRTACLAYRFRQKRPRPVLRRTPYLRIASINIARMANGKCEKGRICARSNPSKKATTCRRLIRQALVPLLTSFQPREDLLHLIDLALLALNDVFAGGNAGMQERPWRGARACCITR